MHRRNHPNNARARRAAGRAADSILDPVGVGFVGTSLLTGLNLKWSYDLFSSKLLAWTGRQGSQDKGKEKGL